MPHKYQREIEEILRNMDHADPRPGLGDRIRGMQRPAPPSPRPPRPPRVLSTPTEVFMGVGILLALVASAIAFLTGVGLLSGVVALIAFTIFAFAMVTTWMERIQGQRTPRVWRGNSARDPIIRGAAVEPTPITRRHRGIMSEAATQMRILRLKWRYWRSRER